MAQYLFSNVGPSNTLAFDPNADVLIFDLPAIQAGDLVVTTQGANVRLYISEYQEIVLLNVTQAQLASSNITFTDGSRLLFGDNSPSQAADNAGNSLVGGSGNDLLAGLGGNDTLNGGAGDDTYVVTAGDVLIDSAGIDTLVVDTNWTIGASFEHLTMSGSANLQVQGHNGNNSVQGNSGNNYFNLRAGNDTIRAGAGNDTIDMSTGGTSSYGNDYIDGGSGIDTVDFDGYARSALVADLGWGSVSGGGDAGAGSASLLDIERFIGGAFNDRIAGSVDANYLDGRSGNDTIDGGDGNDTLIGGAGADTIVFSAAPGSANADQVVGFVAGEKIIFDGVGHARIGASGAFVAGDARFWSSASGTAHDADDRVLYNTSTGQIFYDADGNGAGAAQLVATLQGAPSIAATDISVVNGNQNLVGTSGNDSLVGGESSDTIQGLAGNDTLEGAGGADSIDGGAGNDSIDGDSGADTLAGGAGNDSLYGGHRTQGDGADVFLGGDGDDTLNGWQGMEGDANIETLDGGLGNDHFYADNGADVLIDSGGVDTVHVWDQDWTLAPGFENLYLVGLGGIIRKGVGNEGANFMEGGGYISLEGRGGNDTLIGSSDEDLLFGDDGDDLLFGDGHVDELFGGAGNDTLDGGIEVDSLTGGTGADSFRFSDGDAWSGDAITDFEGGIDRIVLDGAAFTNAGPSGSFSSGDARFWASSGGDAHDADDRVLFDTATNVLWYDADGNGAGVKQRLAMLQDGASLDPTQISVINGSSSGLVVNGTANDDQLVGTSGNDTINGLGGNDDLHGGEGNDVLDGGEGNDRLNNAAGNDTLLGGAGDDVFLTHHPHDTPFGQDVYDGGSGRDWLSFGDADGPAIVNLAAGTVSGPMPGDSATITNIEDVSGTGFADHLIGDANGNTFYGMGAGDTLDGGGGNDTLEGGALLLGGDGNDSLRSFDGNATLQGGAGDDVLRAGNGNDALAGDAGNDRIRTSYGNDTASGGAGMDSFVFEVAGAANADQITDFASGTDELRIDATNFAFEAMPAGDFVAGDARFHAAAGATGGHDAGDRIIYNTTTRQVFYDADGNGSGAAQLLATLQAGATLAATDIGVDGGGGPGLLINGTPGNDSLIGSTGNDTINGLGGNDTIHGNGGLDSLSGGDGNDLISGGAIEGDVGGDFISGGAGDDTLSAATDWRISSPDTLDGGLGNDRYEVDLDDTVIDAGGFDTVIAFETDWTLAEGLENLSIHTDVSESGRTGIGNSLANVMGLSWGGQLEGRGGNDTLWGSGQGDHLFGGDGNDTLRGFDKSDRLDGGAGNDTLTGDGSDGMFYFDEFAFSATPGAANADLVTDFVSVEDRIRLDAEVMPTLGFSGNFMAGDERFHAAAGASGGHDADDRVVYDTSTGRLYYDADGSGSGAAQLLATLEGAPTLVATDIWVDNGVPGATRTGTAGNDSLVGTNGDDSMSGLAGNDTLQGLDGQDTLDGGDDHDRIEGGRGRDQIFAGTGADTVSGGAGVDTINGGSDTSTDLFVFDVAPGAANQDQLLGFVVNQDKIVLDGAVFTAVGPEGNFSAGDARFYASTDTDGEGHDADDRIIYNQNNGNLYYDADGSGSGAALLIANVRSGEFGSAVNLTAVDIRVGMPSGGQSITGTAGNDSLTGTANNDTINGLGGNDTLRGLAGSDSLIGGDGNDDLDGGGGGDDTLLGGNGDDILRGISPESPQRSEVLDGGLGNDEYHIDRWEDALIDAGGVDLVVLHDTSYRLLDGFENLRVEGTQNVVWAATGNSLNNHMTAANSVGAQLLGAEGNDTLVGGIHRDYLTGGSGNDSLVGNAGDDYLHGGDSMSGSLGTDTLSGGAGNDRYIVGLGDVLVEAAGGGTDSVESEVSWTLGADFENLTLMAGAVTANGNNLNNVLTGNDASNTSINGRAGNDTMFGMGGNDVFDMSTGGTSSYGSDVIDGGAGVDSVEFGSNARTAVNINLAAGTVSGGGDGGAGSATLTGVENALGGNFNDTLIGNSAANYFRGSNGNDTLNGGAGNDRLQGDAGNDAFVFDAIGSANSDTVIGFASGADELRLENGVMTALGATGDFAAGDARFWSSTAGTAHDASDRVIYDTDSGQLWYDADGNGSGAAQLIATLQGNPALAATDIGII